MKKVPLQVTLHAHQPSVVDLTLGDCVQLDRLVASPDGHLAERAGELLRPGPNRVALDPGLYFFKTLSPAHLKVVHGGVEATRVTSSGKDPWPPPPPPSSPAPKVVISVGDEPSGEAPELTVE